MQGKPVSHHQGNSLWQRVTLATGPGSLPVMRVGTTKIGLFCPRSVQIPVPLLVGRPDMDLSPSTCESRWAWH